MSQTTERLLEAFLSTTSNDIIPLTAKGVASGCKVFGAAILRKSDLSLVIAATNDETTSPLLVSDLRPPEWKGNGCVLLRARYSTGRSTVSSNSGPYPLISAHHQQTASSSRPTSLARYVRGTRDTYGADIILIISGLSGITWSGFDNHYYLFTYEDTRDAFAIPHDIRILEEVSVSCLSSLHGLRGRATS